jgi:Domain of unknown function (DUF4405)
MTMLVSFIILVLTSIILYIVPQGRIAYWADWHLWGMTKTEWGNLHINLGFLFLLAGLLHIFYNWAPIKAYMKNRARELRVFTPSFNVALLLTLIVGIGTYLEIPPMSSVISLGDSFKDAGAEKYGEPPYGHAELSSLQLFSKKQGLDLDQALELLQKAGIQFNDSKDTLAVIAAANKLSPQEIYKIIKPASAANAEEGKVSFPDTPMPGFGNKSFAAVCSEYNLMFPVIQRSLAQKGVKAEAEMTIKEIAAANEMDAMALFEVIHAVVNESPKN